MKFAFVAKFRRIWPVSWLCKTLDVSKSGFYGWLNHTPSLRSRDDEVMTASIKTSFLGSDRTMAQEGYGRTFWLKTNLVACTA